MFVSITGTNVFRADYSLSYQFIDNPGVDGDKIIVASESEDEALSPTIMIIIIVLGSMFLILVGIIIGFSIHYKRKQRLASVEKLGVEGESALTAMVDDSNHPKKGINLANEDEYKVLEDMLRNEMKVKYGIDNFE